MSINVPFTKENLEECLKALAKEFKKRGKGAPAEIILVGGASVIINYGFRESSYDIDAIYTLSSVMKEAANAVGDANGLPNGWLNDDFKKTPSYTNKIIEFSQYYKTFSGVLTIRTVRSEYLVAMKLVSGRQYKKDLSDIAGIVYEEQVAGTPLTYEMIEKAVIDLYGGWDRVSSYSKEMLARILKCEDLSALFIELSEDEAKAKEILSEVSKKYPHAVTADNADDVIAAALKKKK